MPIALVANSQFPLDEVAAALLSEGIEAAVRYCDQARPSTKQDSFDYAVLIERGQELSRLDDLVAKSRAVLPAGLKLVLCAPVIKAADRELLVTWGISSAITPRSHQPADVAERILGELILDGYQQPVELGKMKGGTRKMRELYQDIETLAPLDKPVLILGETGTGKELVAGEIHGRSGRPGEILPLNCSEFSPDLLASELFGHERGAFTGAATARKGLFAVAGKGTIFLDEIGDMDLQAQAKLLRVIENRQFRPVGSNSLQNFQARLVLATHRDLEEAVAQGKFRQDLWARIKGFTLTLPPLRERLADILLLAHHFVVEYNGDFPKKILKIPDGALDCLFTSDWKDNIRGLRDVIWKAAAYADAAGNISVTWLQEAAYRRENPKLQPHSITFNPATENWRKVQHRAKAAYFRDLLRHTGGDVERAIELSGLSRSQFYAIRKELDDPASDQS